jgi:hypothetical protein
VSVSLNLFRSDAEHGLLGTFRIATPVPQICQVDSMIGVVWFQSDQLGQKFVCLSDVSNGFEQLHFHSTD